MSALADLRWMLPPLAMCLVLTGIHGYLGIHVLSRKVIFVDLSLAQIAALGSICATLLGWDLHEDGLIIYLFSLGFTFVGAGIFALTRMRHEKVPQEAFIGIVYATASAVALLLLARSSGESEHIKEMLVGNVLLVTWPTIAKTAAIYAVIGAFHYVYRKPFLEISEDADAAAARGRRVVLWDFLFYASFGLVITISVSIAGVLMVFTFLVVPGVMAFMFGERLVTRIALAWGVGTVCSGAGMLVSYSGDLPTGPSVVACFGALLVVASLFYYVRGHAPAQRLLALGKVMGGVAIVAGLFFAIRLLRKPPEGHEHGNDLETLIAQLESPDENAQIEAVHHLAEMKDPHVVAALTETLDRAPPERVAEHIVQVLPQLGDASAAASLGRLAQRSDDPFIQLEAAEGLLRLGDASGFAIIGRAMAEEPPLLVEQKAGELLREMAGDDFGLGKSEEDDAREEARGKLDAWLNDRGKSVRWHAELKRFD